MSIAEASGSKNRLNASPDVCIFNKLASVRSRNPSSDIRAKPGFFLHEAKCSLFDKLSGICPTTVRDP